MDLIAEVPGILAATAMGVMPIAVFMLAFYHVVLRQELPNPMVVLAGLGFVLVGLSLLLIGLDAALFPIGRLMVEQLVTVNAVADPQAPGHWTNYFPLYAFAFCVAFGAALAEPALLTISQRVEEISGGAIRAGGLRAMAALGVALGVALGTIRIVAGIPLHWCIGVVMIVIVIQTMWAPRTIVPLAHDAGGASTTAVTVPVITALGLGLAEQLPGRNPLIDGFGLIVLACLLPAVTVLAYAQAAWLIDQLQSRGDSAPGDRKSGGKEE